MRSHRLQLNVNADQVKPVSAARNLVVFVNGEMSMRSSISHVAASCFSAMRQIRSIRRSLPSAAREMLVTSLVYSRLDYCNVVFAGLPACDIRRLQSVLNLSVRLVTGARIYENVTPLECWNASFVSVKQQATRHRWWIFNVQFSDLT